MKILTLPVNLAAFQMLSGTYPDVPLKMEEYREMKRFWEKRFFYQTLQGRTIPAHFDIVKFTNGYGNKVPTVYREFKGFRMGKPNPIWVPENLRESIKDDVFIIHLGEIINL